MTFQLGFHGNLFSLFESELLCEESQWDSESAQELSWHRFCNRPLSCCLLSTWRAWPRQTPVEVKQCLTKSCRGFLFLGVFLFESCLFPARSLFMISLLLLFFIFQPMMSWTDRMNSHNMSQERRKSGQEQWTWGQKPGLKIWPCYYHETEITLIAFWSSVSYWVR